MLIGNYNAQYIGKTMCGFVRDYEYIINIDKNVYGYIVSGVANLTGWEDATAAYINYASENSIRRSWMIKDDNTKIGSD